MAELEHKAARPYHHSSHRLGRKPHARLRYLSLHLTLTPTLARALPLILDALALTPLGRAPLGPLIRRKSLLDGLTSNTPSLR